MYSFGEFRNSIFDDSEDFPPSSASWSPGPDSSSSSGSGSIPPPSSHFEMIRQQMMSSATNTADSLGVLRKVNRGTVRDLEGGLSCTNSDPALPTCVDASSLANILTSKSAEKIVDRDQALRHSHVMETVRSLGKVNERGNGRTHWAARAKQVSKAKVAVGRTSSLPLASTKRQAVTTASPHQTPPPTPPPGSASNSPGQSRSGHQRVRRMTSEPGKAAMPSASASRGQSLSRGASLSMSEVGSRTKSALQRHGSLPTSYGEDRGSRPMPRAPRHLPPLVTEETFKTKSVKSSGQDKEKPSRSKSLTLGDGQIKVPGSSPRSLSLGADELASTGLGGATTKHHGSLKSRPGTGVPPCRPEELAGRKAATTNKMHGSPSPRGPERRGSKKAIPKLRTRTKFIIPEIVITTCPDIEMPDTVPMVPVVQRPTPPQPPSATPSAKPQQARSFAQRAAELRRSRSSPKKDTDTVIGGFSVSY